MILETVRIELLHETGSHVQTTEYVVTASGHDKNYPMTTEENRKRQIMNSQFTLSVFLLVPVLLVQ